MEFNIMRTTAIDRSSEQPRPLLSPPLIHIILGVLINGVTTGVYLIAPESLPIQRALIELIAAAGIVSGVLFVMIGAGTLLVHKHRE